MMYTIKDLHNMLYRHYHSGSSFIQHSLYTRYINHAKAIRENDHLLLNRSRHMSGYYLHEETGEKYPFITIQESPSSDHVNIILIAPERVYKSYEECRKCTRDVIIGAIIDYDTLTGLVIHTIERTTSCPEYRSPYVLSMYPRSVYDNLKTQSVNSVIRPETTMTFCSINIQVQRYDLVNLVQKIAANYMKDAELSYDFLYWLKEERGESCLESCAEKGLISNDKFRCTYTKSKLANENYNMFVDGDIFKMRENTNLDLTDIDFDIKVHVFAGSNDNPYAFVIAHPEMKVHPHVDGTRDRYASVCIQHVTQIVNLIRQEEYETATLLLVNALRSINPGDWYDGFANQYDIAECAECGTLSQGIRMCDNCYDRYCTNCFEDNIFECAYCSNTVCSYCMHECHNCGEIMCYPCSHHFNRYHYCRECIKEVESTMSEFYINSDNSSTNF